MTIPGVPDHVTRSILSCTDRKENAMPEPRRAVSEVISPREAQRRGMCYATLHTDDNETLYCGTHGGQWPCGTPPTGKCGVVHPKLPQDRGCDEPAGHRGYHAVHDGCGRPEYFWNRSHWAFTGRDENGDLDGYVCHCAFGDNHPDAQEMSR